MSTRAGWSPATLLLPLLPLLLPPAAVQAADTRSYTASRFALEIDGAGVGYVKSVDGGNVRGEVVAMPPYLVNKHLGSIKYEPFEVLVGLGMERPLHEWIDGTLRRLSPRKNGAVTIADFEYKAQSRREFYDALISEITFPRLDGASKDAGYLTVKFTPEALVYRKAGGESVAGKLNTKQKAWLTSNFRLELGGLPTTRVATIDPITVKQIAAGAKGQGIVEISSIKISFHAADLDPWQKWFEDFVVAGNSGQERELSGAIRFLSPDMKAELGSLELGNVGIVALYPEKLEANSDKVGRYVAELYVETMKLNLGVDR